MSKVQIGQAFGFWLGLIDSISRVALLFHQAGAGGCIDLSLQCSPLIVAAVDRASQLDEAFTEIACSLPLTDGVFDRPELGVDCRQCCFQLLRQSNPSITAHILQKIEFPLHMGEGIALKTARLDLQNCDLVDQFADRHWNVHLHQLRWIPLVLPPRIPVDSREQRINSPMITRLDISEFPP